MIPPGAPWRGCLLFSHHNIKNYHNPPSATILTSAINSEVVFTAMKILPPVVHRTRDIDYSECMRATHDCVDIVTSSPGYKLFYIHIVYNIQYSVFQ